MLTDSERQRYRRHLQLPEVGEAGQEKLKAARILVVGAGGLGCPVLQYLAAAGVGTLGVADADAVETTNLPRQILYGPADVDQPKAEVAAREIRRINPLVNCVVHRLRVGRANVETLLAGYDLVVDGSDNFATRYLLNDACVGAGLPLVSGAIYRFEGQVSVFNYRGGPTYRCLFPVPPGAADAPDCNTTGVLGVLPGVVGTVQATEALKVVLGLGDVLAGRLWVLDALTMQTRTLRFPRHPQRSLLNLQTANPADYAEATCAPADTLSAAALQMLLAGPEPPFLLDVREPAEFAAGHLPGAALLPLGQLAARVGEVPRTGAVVVYCQAGTRSTAAVAQLRQMFGFANVQSLTGGLAGW